MSGYDGSCSGYDGFLIGEPRPAPGLHGPYEWTLWMDPPWTLPGPLGEPRAAPGLHGPYGPALPHR